MPDVYSPSLQSLYARCPACRRLFDLITLCDGRYAAVPLGDLRLDEWVSCPSCAVPSAVVDWVLCALYPLDFFDVNNLCRCGGEIWYTISQDHPGGALVCDRCGVVGDFTKGGSSFGTATR
ncbi:MAG: hypothetical protein ACPLRU_01930 [Desulfofundulus sp.]|uniref:hypothetical protein n=1 Tax=Desulfofundulus sp. TaxID=2282750 RepID=UPI003C725EA3